MAKIVVAKLYRLMKDGDKYTMDGKKMERSSVKIDDDYIKEFNASTMKSGRMYEIDEKLTAERDALLSGGEKKLDKLTLMAEADELGIDYPKNIPAVKLAAKIEEAKSKL